MKKFLTFLIAIIVAVCIGMVFYQFAKNDEVIKVDATTIYVNYGDKITLDDIGFSRQEPSKDTEINFNAGGEDVTSIIKYDEINKCYIPTEKGGSTTIKITTSNRKYKSFAIDVVVGVGSEENPYYISNEKQLFSIGKDYSLEGHYRLVNDIALTETHLPIGVIDGKYYEFTGTFNGDYKTISNLSISSCDYAGLFATLGSNSVVANLNLKDANINGEFLSVGTVAGTCYGTINRVAVINSTITNTKTASNTGAVVGTLKTDKLTNATASMMRTSAYTDDNKVITANGTLGGLAGTIDSAVVQACYSNLLLENKSNGETGGLAGKLIINSDTYIRESYVVCDIKDSKGSTGNIAGTITLDTNTKLADIDKTTTLLGLYYNSDINKFKAVGSDTYGFTTATTYAVGGKTTNEMKNKSTYVYYITKSNNLVYWDSVWYLADGQYPILNYTNQFTDIEMDDTNTTTPENPDSPDITNPENSQTSSKVVLITNKQELVDAFQTSSSVKGDYILGANINLGGMLWTPVQFEGTLKSSDGSKYTISNFKINSSMAHVGFFSALGKSTISNLTFDSVEIQKNSTTNETVGTLVGYIKGVATINNVKVVRSTITAQSKYAGGLAGYSSNSVIKIENCATDYLIIKGNSNNVGGIIGYSATNTTINKCSAHAYDGLFAIKRVGGISSTNYGLITNSLFGGDIGSIDQTGNDAYFGGLVGVNYGKCSADIAYASFDISNASASNTYFVGGLCGYNLGSFGACFANDQEGDCYIKTGKSTGNIYMAGLAGYNKGSLYGCINRMYYIGDNRATSFTAGLVAYNYGGEINACESYSDLYGNVVAGLALYNGNNGVIDSSFAGKDFTKRATYKGKYVTSFVYQITSGQIVDCLVTAKLNCNSSSGWIAGFAGFMPYSSGMYGTISNCIANVSFEGVGTKYLDIAESGLFQATQTTGTVKDCVISKDAEVSGVIVSEYSKSKFLFWTIKTYEAASGSRYLVTSTQEMQNINTFLSPEVGDFDMDKNQLGKSKWYFSDEIKLPVPRAISMRLYAVG